MADDQDDGSASSPAEHPRLWAPLLAAVGTLIVFWPAVRNGFVNWDDRAYILANHSFRGLAPENLRWMFSTLVAGPYQPLSWLSLALDHQLWGMSPFGFHLMSVLLHALNAALFSCLAARLLALAWGRGLDGPRPWWWGGLAGLLFAWHPLRVESAAWITERRDVLCGAFFLGALLAYLKDREAVGGRVWRMLSWVLCLAAILSKAITAVLPALLLVLDYYPLRRLPANPLEWRRPEPYAVLIEKVPYLLIALPFAILGAVGQRLALGPPELDWISRLLLGAWRFVFYLCKTIFPVGLSPVYDSGAPGVVAGGSLPLVAVLAVLGVTAALWRWGKPWALASWLWYSILVLPVLGVFSFAPQATADRYTYLSCLPWAMLAAAGIARLAENVRLPGSARVGLLASVALLAGVLFVATRLQLEYWRDSESLWRRAVAVTPDSVIARNNLGDLLMARNDLQGAWDHYKLAFDFDPAHVPTNYKLGRVYQSAGMPDAAAMCYERAARLEPTFLPAWSSLGVLLFSMKRPDEAVDILREGLAQKVDERRPGARELRASLMNNLGNVLFESGRQMEALKEYARAIRYEPRDPNGHHNAGAVWELLGQRDKAEFCYREALRVAPGFEASRKALEALRMKPLKKRKASSRVPA